MAFTKTQGLGFASKVEASIPLKLFRQQNKFQISFLHFIFKKNEMFAGRHAKTYVAQR